MRDYLDTYCPECDAEVRARLNNRPATLSVRGEEVPYTETVAICPTCGTAIGDARLEGANLERAYAAYREPRGILSPQEITALRNSYGLSLREFSKFLGFGEQTAYRYEKGNLPDQTHNNTMLSAKSADGAQLLLKQNKTRLAERSVEKIERRIQEMLDGKASDGEASDGGAHRARAASVLERREADAPSAINGYRRLDFDRVSELACTLADKCRSLYWTKFQKAMFFADMASFERCGRSLTGLAYARGTHGPVIDKMDEVRFLLVEQEVVEFQESGWGEVLVPTRTSSQTFDDDEMRLIEEVVEFVDTFDSARELSELTQLLKCWIRSEGRVVIDYTTTDGEVGRTIDERIGELSSA